MKQKKPWDRLDDEGDVAWDSFRKFLDIPGRRRLRDLANKLGCSMRTVEGYSARFKWRERAKAYDALLYQEEVAASINEVVHMRREHIRSLAVARKVGTKRLDGLLKSGASDVAVRDAVNMLMEAIKLERLVIGEVTERIGTLDDNFDWAKLSDEESREYMELRIRMSELEEKARVQ